jgi:2-haloacid dehalogenase
MGLAPHHPASQLGAVMNLRDYSVLTFDCYGTLIDWETGLRAAFADVFTAHRIAVDDERLLQLFAEHESALERGPFVEYKAVLRGVLSSIGKVYGFDPTPDELDRFALSVGDWPPFADSGPSLRALQSRYKLVVLSNVDDDLFARSAEKLGVTFDDVITAQQLRSYKPSTNNFRAALARIGVPQERVLHVAQSLYHDIAPAKALGWSTVWVNRRAGKAGGATPDASTRPDLEVPDLATLARLAGV